MWFWRDAEFQTLKKVAEGAEARPEWADYAAFCLELEKGLRDQAFATLERFIKQMEQASFSDRRCFVSWLLGEKQFCDSAHLLTPHPLRKRIIEPTLKEWTSVEPKSAEPLCWLGGYENFRHALKLDATSEFARYGLIKCILDDVKFATHELPSGYLGDPNGDLMLLTEAEQALSGTSYPDEWRSARADIAKQRKKVTDYLQSR
ncbi:hypothetical protein AYO49_04295 [Verrucomicrobiaceae bacterium SCGC AG-212-N21]|nr:hypothetical protein AYO49_04295 [Verrucomicrobiaceae bacterium SCGC AG-212-N21]